jgi:hypothetical protein
MMKKVLMAAIAIAALAVAGCSKAPDMEMQDAQNAMTAAQNAGAEQYAPDAFRMAKDTLNAALGGKQEQDSKFALFRSYGDSKDMFVRAKTMTDQAVAQAEQEKERVRGEVSALLEQARMAMDSANAALAKAPKGKDNKAELELIRTDLSNLSMAYEQANAEFNAGNYLSAKSKVEAVIEKANAVVSEIAAASGRKAGA